jgi:hypothetical protein
MTDTFDVYHKWLGIPPKDQPPHHYRLLGVEAFEADLDVISAAADQRMVFLRSFKTGKHAAAAEGLLNEISAARVALLDPQRKAAYDAQLRQRTPGAAMPYGGATKPPRLPGAPARKFAELNARQEVALASPELPGVAPSASEKAVIASAVPPQLAASIAQAQAALANKPLPGPLPTAQRPPRLPMGPTAVESLPELTPLADASAGQPQASPAANFDLAGAIQGGLLFLLKLPWLITCWLVRAADHALLSLAGQDNHILHNFLRVTVPLVMCVALGVGTYYAGRYALRELAKGPANDPPTPPPALAHVVKPLDSGNAKNLPPSDTPSPIEESVPQPPDATPAIDPLAQLVLPPRAGPKQSHSYSLAALLEQLTLAENAAQLMNIAAAPGLDNSGEKRSSAEQATTLMNRLAHILTFSEPLPAEHAAKLDELLAALTDTSRKRHIIGTFAGISFRKTKRPSDGLFLVGTVRGSQSYDGVSHCDVELDSNSERLVSVYGNADALVEYKVGDIVVLLGEIFDHPRQDLIGYSGPDQPIVWQGYAKVIGPVSAEPLTVVENVPDPQPSVDPADPVELTEPPDDVAALIEAAKGEWQARRVLAVPITHPRLGAWIAQGLVRRDTKRSWGPEQIEGEPDTQGFGDITTAWASGSQDDQVEWLELGYGEAVVPEEIHVYETYNPGALSAIVGITEDGRNVQLWRGRDPTQPGSGGGISKIRVRERAAVNRLRLTIQSDHVPGWNEIDAVGIVDADGRTHWAVAAAASSTYASGKEPDFLLDEEALRSQLGPHLADIVLKDLRDNSGARPRRPSRREK